MESLYARFFLWSFSVPVIFRFSFPFLFFWRDALFLPFLRPRCTSTHYSVLDPRMITISKKGLSKEKGRLVVWTVKGAQHFHVTVKKRAAFPVSSGVVIFTFQDYYTLFFFCSVCIFPFHLLYREEKKENFFVQPEISFIFHILLLPLFPVRSNASHRLFFFRPQVRKCALLRTRGKCEEEGPQPRVTLAHLRQSSLGWNLALGGEFTPQPHWIGFFLYSDDGVLTYPSIFFCAPITASCAAENFPHSPRFLKNLSPFFFPRQKKKV